LLLLLSWVSEEDSVLQLSFGFHPTASWANKGTIHSQNCIPLVAINISFYKCFFKCQKNLFSEHRIDICPRFNLNVHVYVAFKDKVM
jgi:hypothetical protein